MERYRKKLIVENTPLACQPFDINHTSQNILLKVRKILLRCVILLDYSGVLEDIKPKMCALILRYHEVFSMTLRENPDEYPPMPLDVDIEKWKYQLINKYLEYRLAKTR